MNPNDMTETQIEAWFAASGLDVSVVEHCPISGCVICQPADFPAAA